MFGRLVVFLFLVCGTWGPAGAQTSEFSFQGKLNVSGLPANANYDFEFRLYSVAAGGSSMGTATRPNVPVTDGSFTVQLNFAPGSFDGSDRFLEIYVKPAGGPTFQLLSPRQQISSSPYAIRSQSAANASQLGGISPSGYVLTTDTRLTDARAPLPNSGDYIQNRMTQQSVSNFNVSGSGTVGGTLSGNIVNAATRFDIGGCRVFAVAGTNNTFAGLTAGDSNTTGAANSFFGSDAGTANTNGNSNSFFGALAGDSNTTGDSNSFFGALAGSANTSGTSNAFFGRSAGQANGLGSANSFFGFGTGDSNTDGDNNSFFGAAAGSANTIGSNLAFFGRFAGFANTSGQDNAFFGANAGDSNTTGNDNSFFGRSAGQTNSTGSANTFFGSNAGALSTASNNTFVGALSGDSTTTGSGNTFLGSLAGTANSTGFVNTFIGALAGVANTTGNGNVMLGSGAGGETTSGGSNVFVGTNAGIDNHTGGNNTVIGNAANVGSDSLSFATAIGAGALVFTSNAIVLGRNADDVFIPGTLVLNNLGAAGATQLCRNGSGVVATCSSSARYKRNVSSFASGLDLIKRLRPVSFDWKDGGMHDLGLVAEEVAAVEPLLTTTNGKGEVEGVKYDRIGVVLVNAVKEQQQIIERQQKQIDALTKLVCTSNREADVCKK